MPPDADISRSTPRATASVDSPAADHTPNARFVADARFSRGDRFFQGDRFFLGDLSPDDQFAATLKLAGRTWILACARRGVHDGDGSASLRVHHGFLRRWTVRDSLPAELLAPRAPRIQDSVR